MKVHKSVVIGVALMIVCPVMGLAAEIYCPPVEQVLYSRHSQTWRSDLLNNMPDVWKRLESETVLGLREKGVGKKLSSTGFDFRFHGVYIDTDPDTAAQTLTCAYINAAGNKIKLTPLHSELDDFSGLHLPLHPVGRSWDAVSGDREKHRKECTISRERCGFLIPLISIRLNYFEPAVQMGKKEQAVTLMGLWRQGIVFNVTAPAINGFAYSSSLGGTLTVDLHTRLLVNIQGNEISAYEQVSALGSDNECFGKRAPCTTDESKPVLNRCMDSVLRDNICDDQYGILDIVKQVDDQGNVMEFKCSFYAYSKKTFRKYEHTEL